ncbi:MDR family MFS transporter [Roseixanthobacter pseudopolyaromaticivorans]|uniref:MDR family MFS transporter n=1 Tax=Xanthobacteraceae TaxID=335928 RepID=UPI003726B5E6
MSQAAPSAPAAMQDKASARVWIAVMGTMLGAFMAVLNIQITNSSLANIEGGIGTGADNGAWISTAYLIGEIIVIPLTDYLSRVFSFRLFLMTNAALFLAFSVACAFAQNLSQMIVLRGFQGFCGGVMIPMAFTYTLTKLPKTQQPVGMAMFALTATFAPAIGPTIGGYLTENYGWEYIFFINLVPGAFMLTALALTLDREPMNLALLKEGDWFGIGTMAIGLAALQTVLEEGNKNDWFGSPFITRTALIAVVFLALFLIIEFNVKKPAVNLRVLADRNFALGTVANVMVGFALYGSVFILPQYLGQVQGYNSEQIGSVMAWVGLPQLILIPLVPMLLKRVDARYVVFGGLTIFAISCFMNTHMSVNYGGDQLFWPNIVRAIGQAVILAPLSGIAMRNIARADSAAASGIFNMLRNLGGAVGTAALATIVTKREQFHSNVIGQSVTEFGGVVRDRIAVMQNYFMQHGIPDMETAHHQAIIYLGNLVKRQALVMSYSDTFAIIGVMLLIAAAAVLLTGKGGAGGASAAAH